jgi:site-specific DNA-methyltransferase (adenine-specific)
MIAWVYGSGFPKSLDVSKALDRMAGVEREVVAPPPYKRGKPSQQYSATRKVSYDCDPQPITAPSTDAAKQWSGWGTALKPALEPITVARKPFSGTVAANVMAHGTGALNIEDCRVEGRERTEYGLHNAKRSKANTYGEPSESADFDSNKGRWPANLIHDGSDEVVGLFPDAPGQLAKARTDGVAQGNGVYGALNHVTTNPEPRKDTGSAARFFYCAKASKSDRGPGNQHPTVKPTDLMRYLCRLVTPPGGVILDPFMGSGSTGKAALLEGFKFVGVERDPEYFEIAVRRMQEVSQ